LLAEMDTTFGEPFKTGESQVSEKDESAHDDEAAEPWRKA
jgi:hypothetical protein